MTVERPLRLRFETTDAGLAKLREHKTFAALATSKKKDKAAAARDVAEGERQQAEIEAVLRALPAGEVWADRAAFDKDLKAAAKAQGVKLAAPIKKAIFASFGERDEAAEICRDARGEPEPDAELRDFEYVPLGEDVGDYFDREVRPHAPDAWVDEGKRDEKDGGIGVVGYEIPFGRHFYEYRPPRPLAAIESDIRGLEAEIVTELKAVLA